MIFIDVTKMATAMMKTTVMQMFKFSLMRASSCLCKKFPFISINNNNNRQFPGIYQVKQY